MTKGKKAKTSNISVQAFTLIEVMIALFIFSIIAILTMRGLQTTLNAKQISQHALDTIAEIETAYTIIQQDIEQIINRNVANTNGLNKPALLVPIDNQASAGEKAATKTDDGYNRLEFTRTGVSGSMIRHRVSDLQRVAYYQNDQMLVRHSWRQVDPQANSLVDKRRLLSNVEKLEFFYIDKFGRELQDWKVQKANSTASKMQNNIELPHGIIMRFIIKNYGNIEWVFITPQILEKT